MKKIIDRIQRLEDIRQNNIQTRFPDNSDGFLSALGVDLERFAVRSQNYCGYDFISALELTAESDWKNFEF